jgi:hypothetical protein
LDFDPSAALGSALGMGPPALALFSIGPGNAFSSCRIGKPEELERRFTSSFREQMASGAAERVTEVRVPRVTPGRLKVRTGESAQPLHPVVGMDSIGIESHARVIFSRAR